jgi:hypothetical protein
VSVTRTRTAPRSSSPALSVVTSLPSTAKTPVLCPARAIQRHTACSSRRLASSIRPSTRLLAGSPLSVSLPSAYNDYLVAAYQSHSMQTRALGLEGSEASAEKHVNTLKAKMDGYERILSKQKYLAGDVSAQTLFFGVTCSSGDSISTSPLPICSTSRTARLSTRSTPKLLDPSPMSRSGGTISALVNRGRS